MSNVCPRTPLAITWLQFTNILIQKVINFGIFKAKFYQIYSKTHHLKNFQGSHTQAEPSKSHTACNLPKPNTVWNLTNPAYSCPRTILANTWLQFINLKKIFGGACPLCTHSHATCNSPKLKQFGTPSLGKSCISTHVPEPPCKYMAAICLYFNNNKSFILKFLKAK